jgi:hypothetical protein
VEEKATCVWNRLKNHRDIEYLDRLRPKYGQANRSKEDSVEMKYQAHCLAISQRPSNARGCTRNDIECKPVRGDATEHVHAILVKIQIGRHCRARGNDVTTHCNTDVACMWCAARMGRWRLSEFKRFVVTQSMQKVINTLAHRSE